MTTGTTIGTAASRAEAIRKRQLGRVSFGQPSAWAWAAYCSTQRLNRRRPRGYLTCGSMLWRQIGTRQFEKPVKAGLSDMVVLMKEI